MLDYQKAQKIIKNEDLRGKNPIPDLLGFLHVNRLFGNEFDQILNSYLDKVSKNKKYVKPLLRIDVPKSNFTIRPMARPYLEEWLLFESIINYISKIILTEHSAVCGRSFSILRYKEKIEKATDPWLKFDKKTRELYQNGYKHVVVTDITGYYENINLEELRSRLFDFINDDETNKKYIDALFNMLRKWSLERIDNYGLPQGPPASTFLGDFFLDHVDRKMENHDGYFRYMDDIKIFCKTEIEAKIALKELTIALRDLKLNINAKKTDILHNESIEQLLFDPHHELMNFVDEILNTSNYQLINSSVLPSLYKLFYNAFKEDPFEARHLNFSLYRLGILYNSGIEFDHDKIIKIILSHIESKPHHTAIFCDFLSNFSKSNQVWNELINFLDSENNIYDWQEMKILQCLLKFLVKPKSKEKNTLLRLCQDRNKHQLVNCFYLLICGKHGTNRERDLIKDMYKESDDNYKKMAIVMAIQQLGKPSRNDLYKRIKNTENEEIARFVEYIKSLKGPLYYLDTQKPKIETYKEFILEEY